MFPIFASVSPARPVKQFKVWAFESTKIGGFGGSVVCDRIVRLVLGDVGLEF